MKLWTPEKNSHKGQNGKLLIIGGSKRYHGAAMLAILAARRFVDLVYFVPGEKDPYLVAAVKTIPEVIVLDSISDAPECECILYGVGLAENKLDISSPSLGKPKIIIDGDGLKQTIRFYPKACLTKSIVGQSTLNERGEVVQKVLEFPKNCIITPHEGEFKMLFGIDGTKENVEKMAKQHTITILKKGPVDIISNGKKTRENKLHNQGMTKGGTGDVLAGLVAALACKNDNFVSAFEGARLCGKAGNLCKKEFGFNFCASDLAKRISKAEKPTKR
ncbi:NAD(P)H-hydrate dehydratase [Candidatus Micrarchaeota archaeon]|nr:NAD(P)H-hydrate dehydratase [Candidatus Micrarchaeota archaeon]